MLSFLLRKLFYGFLVMAGVITIVFFLFNILPGDPARMMLGQRADVSSIENINRELGRDKSLAVQYAMYLNDLLPVSVHSTNKSSAWFASEEKYGSIISLFSTAEKSVILKTPYLRRSYQTRQKVSAVIADALPGTVILAFAALIFASIAGVALGVWAALKKNRIADHLISMLAVSGMAIPSFFAGIIIAWLFGFVLSSTTGLNMTGSLYRIDPFEGVVLELKNLILPAFTLGIRPLSVIVQLTRSSMLDVLSQDYIRTAKAKGLSKSVIVMKHALRNALNPVITAVSGWFGSLLAGAVFIEYIFGWKGIGKVTVDSLEQYDFPVVMGAVLVVSLFFIIINVLVDIMYGLLDPRVRVS
jgi:peptide/nickel transport system permease protein